MAADPGFNVTQRAIVYCGNCRAAQFNGSSQKWECWLDAPRVEVFKDTSTPSGYMTISFRPEVKKTDFCLNGQAKVDSEMVR